VWRATKGKFLGPPQVLRGGAQQEGGPVFVFGRLDCLKIPCL